MLETPPSETALLLERALYKLQLGEVGYDIDQNQQQL